MADRRLLEAAARARQEAQIRAVDRVHLDAPDSWAINGPPRCKDCRGETDLGSLGFCRPCWLKRHQPRARLCGIDGCKRRARANGRCRRHTHGDDEWYGWPAHRDAGSSAE